MRLTESTAQLAEKLERLGNTSETAHFLDTLQERVRVLIESKELLDSVVDRVALLRANGRLGTVEVPSVDALMAGIRTVQAEFDSDPRSITKGTRFANIKTRLDRITDDLKRLESECWQAVQNEGPRVDEAFLRLVERVPGQAAKVTQLRIDDQALRGFSRAPRSVADWDDYQRKRTSVQEQLEQLSSDRFPGPVLDFCQAAQSGQGASFVLLTDEVKNWLEQHGLFDRLRVRMGS